METGTAAAGRSAPAATIESPPITCRQTMTPLHGTGVDRRRCARRDRLSASPRCASPPSRNRPGTRRDRLRPSCGAGARALLGSISVASLARLAETVLDLQVALGR
jgi:hypothetical protein